MFNEEQMASLRAIARKVAARTGAEFDEALSEVWLAAQELSKYYGPGTASWQSYVGRFSAMQATKEIMVARVVVHVPSSMTCGEASVFSRDRRPLDFPLGSTQLPTQETLADVARRAELLRSAVESLPPLLREAASMAWLSGHDVTNRAIGEALGIGAPAVRARLRKAKNLLRKRLPRDLF